MFLSAIRRVLVEIITKFIDGFRSLLYMYILRIEQVAGLSVV